MVKVVNNEIYLTRGDSCPLDLEIMNGDEQYDFSDDEVVLTVKKNPNDKIAVIQKTFTDGKILIEPSDTEGLEFGSYWFDVKLKMEDGTTDTVIVPSVFNVMNNVSWG